MQPRTDSNRRRAWIPGLAAGLLLAITCGFLCPFRPARAAPERDVPDLRATAPLDVDVRGSEPDRLAPEIWHVLLLFAAPALYAAAYLARRPHGILGLVLILAAPRANAASAGERRFEWERANVEMAAGRTPDDFIAPAARYQALIADGVRNGHVFYNLGTAWLKAGQARPALAAFERAERYDGARPDVRRNMTIARHLLPPRSSPGTAAWARLLFFWHFLLGTRTRITITVCAYSAAWLALVARLFGLARLSKPCFVFSLVILVLFGSSAGASLLAELAARNTDIAPEWPAQHATRARARIADRPPTPDTNTPHTPDNVSTPNAPPTTFPPADSVVLPHPLAPANDVPPITAHLHVHPRAPYRFQTFAVTLTIRASGVRMGHGLRLEGFPAADVLEREPFKELPFEQTSAGQKVVETRRYRCTARALDLDLPVLHPKLFISVLDPGSVYGQEGHEVFYRVALDPLPIAVRPLPRETQPPDFSGAVGDFALRAEVTPSTAHVGRPVRLVVHLEGAGYVRNMRAPGVRHAAGCRLRTPRRFPAEPSRPLAYEQLIIPQSRTVSEIPPVTFSYFDPVGATYKTLRAGPFALRFAPTQPYARFAPSQLAQATFRIAADAEPDVLERTDGWLKVRVGRRIGWIRANDAHR